MDQQNHQQVRRETDKPQKEQELHRSRSPERELSADAARAIRLGAPVWELSPKVLTQLAGKIGNSAMIALSERGAKTPDTAEFIPPPFEPKTVPAEVPTLNCQTVDPSGLTAHTPVTAGFDAAGLRS
ncbi:MAG: hypothetical protein ACOYI3_04400 [Christensenellales bacterium]